MPRIQDDSQSISRVSPESLWESKSPPESKSERLTAVPEPVKFQVNSVLKLVGTVCPSHCTVLKLVGTVCPSHCTASPAHLRNIPLHPIVPTTAYYYAHLTRQSHSVSCSLVSFLPFPAYEPVPHHTQPTPSTSHAFPSPPLTRHTASAGLQCPALPCPALPYKPPAL